MIVLNVIPQGPSDKAGVKAGDRIVEIGDSVVAGQKIPQNNVVKMLRGPRGTTVHLGIGRQGISGLVPIDVERGVIPIRSIESAFRIVDGVGYVKLGQFARTTYDEFHKALASLRAEGVTKLIFDLRGNSGGFLDQAIAVANEFLHKDQLIVYTEDRRHEQLREYADGNGSAQDMEVVVLIDEGSASSSEILAGALQDNDRGTIVGRRSFGKGLVQRQIPYSDGSALRLTTARYYTPTGRSIQKPYTIGDDAGYEEDIWNRYKNNEFFSADSIHFADSLKRVTPGGKVVYGGGGIMPDVFIPADTTDVTKYFIEVAGRNILYRYTIEYADRHREALNAGQEDGTHWLPAEVDVSIRPGWYYHEAEDSLVRTVPQLLDIYYASVGRNASMLLNVPPDKTGRIPAVDSLRLMEFARALAAEFSKDLAADARVSASNVRGHSGKYGAMRVTHHLRSGAILLRVGSLG